MPATFAELYSGLLKDVFVEHARRDLEQGADVFMCADTYAEQGKPDFTLAYLLLLPVDDTVKQDMLAHAYERRADLSEEKAEDLDKQFHRPFPLIKLEAHKDRMAAQQVRQGKRIRREVKSLNVN
ncbi:MAG TPA: hypothetical protein VII61_23600 [Ktedonobacteraceae bacterium]